MATGHDAKRPFDRPPSLESVLHKQQLIAFLVLLLILSAIFGLVFGL
jgi:putative exporter of polyketide antibiotics